MLQIQSTMANFLSVTFIDGLMYKGCAPPGSESLGCKETLNLGQFGDFLDRVVGKEIPRGYHCTCNRNLCNSANRSLAIPSALLLGALVLILGFNRL